MTTDENNDDDEATLPASGDAVDEIRAEAARARSEQEAAFDPSDDPTTVMAHVDDDLGEPTIIGSFDPAEDPTIITFDAAGDPTTVVATSQSEVASPKKQKVVPKQKTAPRVASANGSLIDGKAPPDSSTSYWDRNELGAATMTDVSKGKGPVPKWFIATSLLAVVLACGLVLLVMWALSGST